MWWLGRSPNHHIHGSLFRARQFFITLPGRRRDEEYCMSSEATCIFCRVIAGEAQASLVYQDELVTSFMDIRPVNDGHLLIVPNRHSSNLAGVDGVTGGRMFTVAMRLGAALRTAGVSCEGVNLYLADGRAGARR